MTAKEKAQELYGKHYQIAMNSTNPKYRSSKVIKGHCIIHIKGIIEEVDRIHFRFIIDNEKTRKYWNEVLTELNQM